MEKQARAGKDRAWASRGHLGRKLNGAVTFFLSRVTCPLLPEGGVLPSAGSALRPGRGTPQTATSSCSLQNTPQRVWVVLVTASLNYLGRTAVTLWNSATLSVEWGFQTGLPSSSNAVSRVVGRPIQILPSFPRSQHLSELFKALSSDIFTFSGAFLLCKQSFQDPRNKSTPKVQSR